MSNILFSLLLFSAIVTFGDDRVRNDAESESQDDGDNRNVSFYLYTRKNYRVGYKLVDKDIESLKNSHYSKDKTTKLIIHGWLGNYKEQLNPLIKNTFLQHYDANAIVVDWSDDSRKPYAEAVRLVPSVAKRCASLIDWLVELGTPLEAFHVLGYSLGGQVAGFTGRLVKSGQVGYLTGLDPAKSLYEDSDDCIGADDAAYVEILHTNPDAFGVARPRGHNDFYPNHGERQMPGCRDDACSHDRSYEYFAESLARDGAFAAAQCSSYDELAAGRCANLSRLPMGGGAAKPKLGVFYLRTNDEPPFSIN